MKTCEGGGRLTGEEDASSSAGSVAAGPMIGLLRCRPGPGAGGGGGGQRADGATPRRRELPVLMLRSSHG